MGKSDLQKKRLSLKGGRHIEKELYFIADRLERNNWWYKARRELFEGLLRKYSGSGAMVDLGCGVGSNLEMLRRHSGQVVGVDNCRKALEYCRKKGFQGLKLASIEKLDLPKNSFAVALCADVLEHVNDVRAIEQVANILKPGAILIISVPAHRWLWTLYDNVSHHKKRYEKIALKLLLDKKFKIEKLSYWNLSSLFPLFIYSHLERLLSRHPNKANNILEQLPGFLNRLLYHVMKIENFIFMKTGIPQGVSIVAVARKK